MIKAVLSAFYRWREKIMKKRILGAMLIIMALLMMPSCSLEGALRAFGSNITGPSEESKVAINEAVASVENIGSTAWTDNDIKNFADSISAINGNPAAINQFVKEMSKSLPEDSAAKASSTQIASTLNSMVQDIKNEADFDTGNAVLNDAVNKALSALEKLSDASYTPSYGDALFMKVAEFALNEVERISNGGDVDYEDMLDLVSGVVPVITSVLPATSFSSIDLGAVLNEVVKMATSSNTSEEGGEAV